VYVIAAIALLLALCLFAGPWMGERASGLQLGRWIVFESRRSEALRHRAEAVAQGAEIKKAIISDLLADRLTLREAAAQFREANQLVESGIPDMVADYRTPTSEQGLCRQVLAWVRAEVQKLPPDRAQRILASLETEFESLFGHPEPVTTSPLESEP
jgi:hypothetical protein